MSRGMTLKTVDFNQTILNEPIFGPGAPEPEALNPAKVKNSIYEPQNRKSKFCTNSVNYFQEEYHFRLKCIQGWYLRCSWQEKIAFVRQISEMTMGVYILEEILKYIDSIYSKDVIDSFARDRIKFLYDKVPSDDNRALTPKQLIMTRQDDAFWFYSLDSASQIDVILVLLKLGGGGLIFNFYKFVDKLFRERKEMNKVLEAVGLSIIELSLEKSDHSTLTAATNSSEELIPEEGDYSLMKHEQMKRRENELNEFKRKYGLFETANAGKNNKPKKADVNPETVDYVQVLPLWINRKIMLFLNDKDLGELKKTGKYWTKMIEEAVRESIGRNQIKGKIYKIAVNTPEAEDASDKEERRSISSKEIPVLGEKKLRKHLNVKQSDFNRIQLQDGNVSKWNFLVHEWDSTVFRNINCSVNFACKYLAATTPNKTVNFYSIRTGKRTKNVISGLKSTGTSLAIHDEGFHVVIGFSDGSLKCYNLWKNQKLLSYKGHTASVTHLVISNDKLLSASEDQTIKKHDLWTGLCLLCVGLDSVVKSVLKLQQDPAFFITGTAAGKLVFIDLKKKRIYGEVYVHEQEVTQIVEDGTLLMTGSPEKTIRLWNLADLLAAKQKINVMPFLDIRVSKPVTAMQCLDHQIFAACTDGKLRIINKLTGVIIREFEITARRPIKGMYLYREREYLKAIIWHGHGIEMRVFFKKVVQRKKEVHPQTIAATEIQPIGINFPSIVTSDAYMSVYREPRPVKQIKAKSVEDRDKVIADRSCTIPDLRQTVPFSVPFNQDIFSYFAETYDVLQSKDQKLIPFPRFMCLEGDLATYSKGSMIQEGRSGGHFLG